MFYDTILYLFMLCEINDFSLSLTPLNLIIRFTLLNELLIIISMAYTPRICESDS